MATRKPSKRRRPANASSGARRTARASAKTRTPRRTAKGGSRKATKGATAKKSAKPKARPGAKAAKPGAKITRRTKTRARAKATTRTKATPTRKATKVTTRRRATAPAGASTAPRQRNTGGTPKAPHATRPATLERQRRTLADDERFDSTGGDDRLLSAARSGHDELASELRKHTAASPKLTAGDLDAKWQDAYAVGDEAPGGDNPTPDQDIVDDIGKAVGITYQDDEELRGGEEVADRDRHRWERDPASSDDWPEGHEK